MGSVWFLLSLLRGYYKSCIICLTGHPDDREYRIDCRYVLSELWERIGVIVTFVGSRLDVSQFYLFGCCDMDLASWFIYKLFFLNNKYNYLICWLIAGLLRNCVDLILCQTNLYECLSNNLMCRFCNSDGLLLFLVIVVYHSFSEIICYCL